MLESVYVLTRARILLPMAILLKEPQQGNAAYPAYARILYTMYMKGMH